jgi:hypothetical protein
MNISDGLKLKATESIATASQNTSTSRQLADVSKRGCAPKSSHSKSAGVCRPPGVRGSCRLLRFIALRMDRDLRVRGRGRGRVKVRVRVED